MLLQHFLSGKHGGRLFDDLCGGRCFDAKQEHVPFDSDQDCDGDAARQIMHHKEGN